MSISGSSLRPCTLTPHFHKVCGYCDGSSVTQGHLHTQPHRWWLILAYPSGWWFGIEMSFLLTRKSWGSDLTPEKCTENHFWAWCGIRRRCRHVCPLLESILTSVKRVREGRSITVKQFQKLLGLMSAASNVIPFGLLYMRLKTKRFSPRGNPLCMIKVTRRCLRALDMWRNMSKACLRHASDGCISHQLGSGHEWPPCPRSVEGSPSHVAHSIQDYLYSAFYDTIIAKQLYRKLSFYNRFIYCRNLIYLTYG